MSKSAPALDDLDDAKRYITYDIGELTCALEEAGDVP